MHGYADLIERAMWAAGGAAVVFLALFAWAVHAIYRWYNPKRRSQLTEKKP